jgi:hypothetical protein
MKKSILELLRRPVAYQPILAKAFGSVKLALMWSQLYYWSDKTKDPEGWVYKSRTEMFEETGLSSKEQINARDLGVKLGILHCVAKMMPRTTHYRVDLDKTIELLEEYLEKKPAKGQQALVITDPASQDVQKVFEVFYRSINPNINFGHKTSRKAALFLIQKHGLDKTINAAIYACSLFGKQHAPVISTPYQLKEKMTALAAYKIRQQGAGGKGKDYDHGIG